MGPAREHDGHGHDHDHHGPGPGPDVHHHERDCPPVYVPLSDTYDREGVRPDCRVWTFTSETPNTRSERFNMQEYGTHCRYSVVPHYDPFRPRCVSHYEAIEIGCEPYQSDYGHSRQLTVEIGPRQLQPGQKEDIKVCQTGEIQAAVDVSQMAFEYAVKETNESSFFKKATKFTLTPGQPKPAGPAAAK